MVNPAMGMMLCSFMLAFEKVYYIINYVKENFSEIYHDVIHTSKTRLPDRNSKLPFI